MAQSRRVCCGGRVRAGDREPKLARRTDVAEGVQRGDAVMKPRATASTKSGSSSAENSNRSSPQGREIQRVISNYADAAKIGRKIADEAREKSRADDSSASNSPMSVSAPSPQSYLQRNVSEPDGRWTHFPSRGLCFVTLPIQAPTPPATTA